MEIHVPHEDGGVEEIRDRGIGESIGEWPHGRDSEGFNGTKVRKGGQSD